MPTQTKVIRLQHEKCDIRIDRTTKWGNPFIINSNNTRKMVIAQYEQYIRQERQDLIDALPELVGKTLGCWCKPLPCHGDVLIKLMQEKGLIDVNGFPI